MTLTVRDIMEVMEAWAPRTLAWERDNVGLLIGSPDQPVTSVLVALDVTPRVIEEAVKRSANLLITHHPLIFGTVRTITDGDRNGTLIAELIRRGIALYAAHTNLDFTRSGVSAKLARLLGLVDAEVLHQDLHRYQKIVVFVPAAHTEPVMQAMAAAGAGQIGKYDACSFRTSGHGTFRPLAGAKPFIGSENTLEEVAEVRLEMICPAWQTGRVLAAMRTTHPYEEVAYDLYDLANASPEYGAGMIGTLPEGQTLGAFLAVVCRALNTPVVRYSGDVRRTVRRIAVCGGSGSDLLPVAIGRKADVLVTADVKYHAFQDAEGRIALIDAGHFETEHPIVEEIVSIVAAHCRKRGAGIPVTAARRSHNPVQYFTA